MHMPTPSPAYATASSGNDAMARTATEFRNLPGLKPGSGYSDLVVADGFAFLAGKVAADRAGAVKLGGIEHETRMCMELLVDTLSLAGLSLSDVVKVTIFMKHLDEFDRMNAVYRGFFTEGRQPARTTIGVADIVLGCRVEIECVARIAQR
jgi:2-iminobutanoate/2-iminopropanoate deaminase